MREIFANFLKAGFEEYDAPAYLSEVEKQSFNNSVVRMLEMKKLIKKSIEIVNLVDVPFKLIDRLEGIVGDFMEMKVLLDESRTPKAGYTPNNIFNRIHSIHTNFFEPSSSNGTMMTINAISNYETFFADKSIDKLESLNAELDDKNKRVDQILLKLEKPSAEKVLSDYATEYENEEKKNNSKSVIWLFVGIGSTVLFIVLVLLSLITIGCH
jgi:hypothetical protein